MKNKYLSTSSEWTFELIAQYDKVIGEIAKSYNLDTYPVQIEVITAEQMIDAYSATGMPLGYHHWSFGKQFLQIEQEYLHGYSGLAYEIVINSNPCIAYLLEHNSMMMQALVIAHACYGHNSFFKSNYLFQTWTNANFIIDYLVFAKNYITECEEKYGVEAVEEIIDACHSLMNYGVDKYKRPPKLSIAQEKLRQKDREEYLQSQVNDLWRTLPKKNEKHPHEIEKRFPEEPQENILYFIEKNAPLLEAWQREVIRIVRKIAQYFYPQKQTKLMNEGWATFWHYIIMNELYQKKLVNDDFMLEFIQNHTNVMSQLPFDHPLYLGINPYTLGYKIFMDLKRICENPTTEDHEWFPEFAGRNWVEALDIAMRNYKDESFISQFLSPHLIRDLKLFIINDDEKNNDLVISAIHNEDGYQKIRETLSDSYNLNTNEPNIQVYDVDMRGDRSLTLRYIQYERRPLEKDDAKKILRHIHKLWGFKVRLEVEYPDETVKLLMQYPEDVLPEIT
ncbi:MAG: SpoVR family protein [Gammaproteobacteria bacterium]